MHPAGQVTKVETRLENPTQFYMQQSQRRQVQEYLSQKDTDGGGSHQMTDGWSPQVAPPPSAWSGCQMSTDTQNSSRQLSNPGQLVFQKYNSCGKSATESDSGHASMPENQQLPLPGQQMAPPPVVPKSGPPPSLMSGCPMPTDTLDSSRQLSNPGQLVFQKYNSCGKSAMEGDSGHPSMPKNQLLQLSTQQMVAPPVVPKSAPPFGHRQNHAEVEVISDGIMCSASAPEIHQDRGRVSVDENKVRF